MTVNEKVGGRYKPSQGSALAEDIQASVCKAAVQQAVVQEPRQKKAQAKAKAKAKAKANAEEEPPREK